MRLLLIDTCDEEGSLALAESGTVLLEKILPPRMASAQLVAHLRAGTESLGWSVDSLHGVGVVSGPGSFTGVRVGMGAAKGLCEVAGVPLAAVSRLELLLALGNSKGGDLAALDAGRGEFYVRSAASGEEVLMSRDQVLEQAGNGRVLIAEERLMPAFQPYRVAVVKLSASDALSLMQREIGRGGVPVDTADANYVRQARGLYGAKGASELPVMR